MGINLGAAMSPLLCGYIGETYGWHYGFGLATLGMLTGVAVFVAPGTDEEATRTRAGLKTERSSTSANAALDGASKRGSGVSSSTGAARACTGGTKISGRGANTR